MRRNLWITISFILLVVVLAVFIDIPKSFLWGNKIKATLGLDLVGGTELVYQADLSQSTNKTKDLTNLSSVFRSRIDSLGVSEPVIQTSGSDRIIIELPGIKNIDEAISKIGDTYEMVFMEEASGPDTGVSLVDFYDSTYSYPGYWQKTDLTGKQLKSADVTFQGATSTSAKSEPVVSIRFDNAGTQKFAALTKKNLNKRIAIVLDNKIVSAPTVQTEITNGEAVITGSKDVAESKKLADRLNEGMLPVPAQLVGQKNIGATLGQDSLRNSMVAGIIGLIMVSLFIAIYYKTAGLVAVFSLGIYALITMAIYKLIPVTMTLAGIAGFVLSVGMAIDANILIFERMKEELALGKTLLGAITDGFSRAFSSVKDSNFSSIITCFILYITAGSGPVRGFALTLGIGIVISLFTAITVTRTLLVLIAGSKAKGFIHV